MIKDTLMRDILNTFSFLDDDQPMDDDVRLSPLPPDQTLKDSSLTTLSPVRIRSVLSSYRLYVLLCVLMSDACCVFYRLYYFLSTYFVSLLSKTSFSSLFVNVSLLSCKFDFLKLFKEPQFERKTL